MEIICVLTVFLTIFKKSTLKLYISHCPILIKTLNLQLFNDGNLVKIRNRPATVNNSGKRNYKSDTMLNVHIDEAFVE